MFLPVEHRSYNRVFKISSTFKLMFRLGSIKKVVMQFKYFHAKFRKILISTGVKQLLGVCQHLGVAPKRWKSFSFVRENYIKTPKNMIVTSEQGGKQQCAGQNATSSHQLLCQSDLKPIISLTTQIGLIYGLSAYQFFR